MLTQPYLLTVNPSKEMNILWIQREKNTGTVEFGSTSDLGKKVTAQCHKITGLRMPASNGRYAENPEDNPEASVWQYIAKIENLSPGETVFYRCLCGDKVTQIYSFHTAPEHGGEFSFAQLSDLQVTEKCDETVYKIGCMHPDFLLYSGDFTHLSWRMDQWFDVGEQWQDADAAKRAFFPCMQQQNGARLMQYAPTFVCPGNHDYDDWRCCVDVEFSQVEENWNWSIFMQLFRPLYPDPDTTLTGRRWYCANYGDMHIISLSINRLEAWDSFEAPGWRLYDPIDPESEQIKWLKKDFKSDNSKFKWVIQHFHILNKGEDVQFNLCAPETDDEGNISYPHDHGGMLMDLFQTNGVNAVTFGHSHVYERYYNKGTHYIEAAYLTSACYRKEDALPHPSGLLPVMEDNSRRSFLIVKRKKEGLFGFGYYVDDVPVLFDEYQIADENGHGVPPVK